MFILGSGEWGEDSCGISWSLCMAIVEHRSAHETNVCAVKFCLTWVGFFAAIGLFTYLVSML